MSNVANQIIDRTTGMKVPHCSGNPTLQIVLGVVNFIGFGIGTIIAGALNNDLADVIIGVLQLCIPFVGWVWSIIWGVFMILDTRK